MEMIFGPTSMAEAEAKESGDAKNAESSMLLISQTWMMLM